MSSIKKGVAVITIILGILIILQATERFILEIPFDLYIVGALAMLVSQIFNLFMLRITNKTLTTMQIITFIVFILPALAYLAGYFLTITIIDSIPLILGIMLLIESLYALH